MEILNPHSNQVVNVSANDINDRFDSCLLTFATHEERNAVEGLDANEAIKVFINQFGAERLSEIWFS